MAIKPIKVSQLSSYIKRILQSDPLLGNVTVIGEISNLKHHGTGHVYFTLKDESSKLSCFLPADVMKNLRYELTDGMEITAAGYIYLYERGGSYSLNVRDIIVEGKGSLAIAFEKLKEKLSLEGLFEQKYKKDLPTFPNKIAVVTSETGAAVKDILKIIQSRNNYVDVIVYPCLVQGPSAAKEISNAIDNLNLRFPEIDLMIVGRGGGSIEELWAFNEEIVARSIFASKIPIISAVGHEIDVTIADFVADKRAETPTAAAQLAVPNIEELKEYINIIKISLDRNLAQYLKYLEMRLQQNNLQGLRMALEGRIQLNKIQVDNFLRIIRECVNDKIKNHELTLKEYKLTLDTLNPQNIMAKGYAAITDENGILINSAVILKKGQNLNIQFKDGSANTKVEKIVLKGVEGV